MKNKLFNILLIFCLMMPLALLLSACGPHTHQTIKVPANAPECETTGNTEYYTCTCGKYFSDATAQNEIEKNSWIIDAIQHDWELDTWYDEERLFPRTSKCLNNPNHTKIHSSVYVDQTNIEKALNPANIENRNWISYNLNLAPGNYSEIIIKEGKRSIQGNGSSSSPYIHNRSINSISLIGSDPETTIIDGFSFLTSIGYVYTDQTNTEIDYYYNYNFSVRNLTIKNVTFTNTIFLNNGTINNDGLIHLPGLSITNITLDNVTFDFTNNNHDDAAFHIISENSDIDNVTIKNCTFKNISNNSAIKIDLRIADDINIFITNNTFTNINYNAIQLTGTNGKFLGIINILNNNITNINDIAVSISTIGENAMVSVSNNIMINASNNDGELIKATNIESTYISIHANYWGAKLGKIPVKGIVNENGDNVLDTIPRTSPGV